MPPKKTVVPPVLSFEEMLLAFKPNSLERKILIEKQLAIEDAGLEKIFKAI